MIVLDATDMARLVDRFAPQPTGQAPYQTGDLGAFLTPGGWSASSELDNAMDNPQWHPRVLLRPDERLIYLFASTS